MERERGIAERQRTERLARDRAVMEDGLAWIEGRLRDGATQDALAALDDLLRRVTTRICPPTPGRS